MPRLMQVVYEVHQVLRRAVARRRREIPRGLISPRTIERVLGDRHEFNMRKSGLIEILGQGMRQFPVIEKVAVLAAPGTGVQFIDGHGRIQAVSRGARRHPGPIAPGVVQVPYARCRRGRQLTESSERVRFFDPVAAHVRGNSVLVRLAVLHARHAAFPDSGVIAARRQPVAVRVPAVPIADHRNFRSIGSPHGEAHAAAISGRMRAQLRIEPTVRAFAEQINILVGQHECRLT